MKLYSRRKKSVHVGHGAVLVFRGKKVRNVCLPPRPTVKLSRQELARDEHRTSQPA